MFDGKSMTGWHSYQQDTITKVLGKPGWAISDSAIFRVASGAGGLLAPEKFVAKNFEISIDWKVADNGNSGLFLRYLETEAKEFIRTGPETQICGKAHDNYGDGMQTTSPGACYDMYPPAKPWIRPADQYNTLKVIMFENHVAHYGNGIKLLEYEIGSDDWKAKYAASKYALFPLYGDVHAGKLLLQDHGNSVWFRNLKVRPLSVDPWTDKSFVWPDQEISSIRSGSMFRSPAPSQGNFQVLDWRGRRLGHTEGSGSWRTQLATGLYILQGPVEKDAFAGKIIVR